MLLKKYIYVCLLTDETMDPPLVMFCAIVMICGVDTLMAVVTGVIVIGAFCLAVGVTANISNCSNLSLVVQE